MINTSPSSGSSPALLLQLGVALFADIGLRTVDLDLVKALDRLPLADGAGCLAMIDELSDSGSSMCFGHIAYSYEVDFALAAI